MPKAKEILFEIKIEKYGCVSQKSNGDISISSDCHVMLWLRYTQQQCVEWSELNVHIIGMFWFLVLDLLLLLFLFLANVPNLFLVIFFFFYLCVCTVQSIYPFIIESKQEVKTKKMEHAHITILTGLHLQLMYSSFVLGRKYMNK